jgi:hypothetical protein
MDLTIDCPPGKTRPDTLIKQVMDGIDIIQITNTDIFFGEQTFFVNYRSTDGEDDMETVRIRLIKFYNSGLIRYADWRCKKLVEKSNPIQNA